MEISNEIKAKVFAQYLGQKVEYDNRIGIVVSYHLVYKTEDVWFLSLEEDGNSEMSCSANISKCKLLLEP